MGESKPLTSAQRRAAERLLVEEEHRLWQEFHAEFERRGNHDYEQRAKEEWRKANPKFVAVEKKVEAYVRRANKRLKELCDEAQASTRGLKRVDGAGAYGTLSPYIEGDHLSHARIVTPWHNRTAELRTEFLERKQKVSNAIQARVEQGRRNILLATLGDVGQDLITLPSLDEIIKGID